jgi:PAS domain S-box-containing protein
MPFPLNVTDENAALRSITEGTATHTGERFFEALVVNLAKVLNTHSAWVTEYLEETRQLHALAFWSEGRLTRDFLLDIDGTPCEQVIETTEMVHYPEGLLRFYPRDAALKRFEAVSYLGAPLLDKNRKILGNLAVLDTRPMPKEPRAMAIFQIFAARASAELQRIRAEAAVRKSEEKFRRIIETTPNGFMLLNRDFTITDANDALCQMIGLRREEIIGRNPLKFAPEDQRDFFVVNREELFSGRYRELEGNLVNHSGRKIPVLIHSDTLRGDHGEVIGNMIFVTDLTQQKKSLALAAELQKSLLPKKSPRISGFDIAGKAISCDEIGGDYFDFLAERQCQQNQVDIVVGDVVGHGVDAALLMTTARAFLRMRASQCGSICEIVTEMNRHLTMDVLDSGRFMTLFFLRIDADARRLRWVRAGHAPAIVYEPRLDRFSELKGAGMALGLDGSYRYEENPPFEANADRIIAVGTDGIWESRNRAGEFYGMDRFRQILREHAHRKSAEIITTVFEDVKSFSAGRRLEDDLTLVIVKTDGRRRRVADWQI